MKSVEKLRSKGVYWGIALGIVTFFIYYFFIEERVHEHRLTYSVAESDYPTYLDTLKPIYIERNDFTLSLVPNYMSIADSLTEEGIRRFELREYHTGVFSIDDVAEVYFNSSFDIEAPGLIGDRLVGSSTPLKTSMGVSMLILTLVLLIDYLFFLRKR